MKGWMIQRLLGSLNFFLSGLLVLALVGMARDWTAYRDGFSEPMPAIGNGDERASEARFGPQGPVSLKEPVLEGDFETEEAPLFQFRGVASVGTRFFAVIESGGQQSLVKEGQVFEGWKVSEISEREMILEREGGRPIRLFRQGISSVAGDEADPASVRAVDETRRELDQKSYENILSHWADMLRDVRLFPYVERGKSLGYVVLNVRPGSLVEELGFRTGDIIQRVNGREVTSLEAVLSLYDWDEAGELKIAVRRGMKEIELVYPVRPPETSSLSYQKSK